MQHILAHSRPQMQAEPLQPIKYDNKNMVIKKLELYWNFLGQMEDTCKV